MLIPITEEDLWEGTLGVCVICGHLQYGVEPDAEGYVCESCSRPKVYGCEQAVLLGMVEVLADE